MVSVKVIGLIGLVLVVAGVALMFAGNATWSAPINKTLPPTSNVPTPTVTPPVTGDSGNGNNACPWDYSGRFTIQLLKNGKVLKSWERSLALIGGGGAPPTAWGLRGKVEFRMNTCGAQYGYAVIVYAVIKKVGEVTQPPSMPTVTSSPPTTTTTGGWVPPPSPPGHPRPLPISVLPVGENRTVTLFATNGVSSGAFTVNWGADIGKVIEGFGPGKYSVSVFAEVAYSGSGHEARIYSDVINIGVFTFDGNTLTYG